MHRRSKIAILIAIVTVLSAHPCLAQQPFTGTARAPLSPPTVESVLLIGWDGVQRHHLMELLMAGRLPNLNALIEEGSFESIGISGHATDTKSGWTQILTGYEPDVTGVYSNRQYQPIPVGLSVFERAQKAFGRENVFTMMVTGKAAHVGSVGPGEPTASPQAQKVEQFGQPFFNTRKALDVWVGDKGRQAEEVGTAALAALEQAVGERFLAFVHFSDPDHKGHAQGENSPEYEEAIVTCDEWLGRLVQWIKDKGLYEKTRIYVVTDHGFDENGKSHRYAPRSWLATNDNAVISGGHMRDIAPTLLVRMGVDVDRLQPAYGGGPLIDSVPFRRQRARPQARAARLRRLP